MTTTEGTWRTHAACANHAPDLWDGGDGPDGLEAIRICFSECTVRRTCLLHALECNISDGIWGGLTPTVRAAMKRRGSVA